ncbi:sphingomyelin phosphodiesterase [Vararia minispora EC-137]|uniref:Sphingomyelin phosphodiesterase n=1 Tax=Vararia minispora EC-137 TaxID=1314806 RepID=A0ACB8QT48_9AGAM|nr:sphingomyelin phosphodiesterase [Vararia minispora EC-137]
MRVSAILSQLLALTTAPLCVRAATDNLVQEIISALKQAVDCASCQGILIPAAKALADFGDTAFIDTFTTVCQVLGLEDDDVCAGQFALSGPSVANALRVMDPLGATATKFCFALFGLCNQPSVTPFNVSFPTPTPPTPAVFQSTGGTPFQVVHFSDVHIDRNYTVGSNANCTKPICCRDFADSPANTTDPAGPFGNHQCDAPPDLGSSMIQAIDSLAADARFAILTGDVVAHDTWLVNEGEATIDLQDWTADMAAGLKTTVYPALGNHDTAPVNSFPRNVTSTENVQWVFDLSSDGWERWIGNSAADQVRHDSGSYAAQVPGTNLTVISLNTNFWYIDNLMLYDSNEQIADPNNILAFMVQSLQAVESAGGRAWIIGHIPPGLSDVFHDQSNYYDQVLQRYKNTIAGQFFGHTHVDQFQVAYSDYANRNAQTADGFAWIMPSLTPTSGHPSFRVYDVDPDTYEIMDAHTFIANMSDPNFQTNPTWELFYSARETYGSLLATPPSATESLNATFWHQVTDVFELDTNAFQAYFARRTRDFDVGSCDASCQTTTICDLRAMRSQNNCDVVTPGFNFKREEHQELVVRHECESVTGSIFRRMARMRQ